MTTRLAGTATHFLPFNKGQDGGAGNPPDPQGRTYRTAYLWEEVLQRDSLLELLARFLHLQIEEKRTEDGRKVKKETMIFPRYHQRASGSAGWLTPRARRGRAIIIWSNIPPAAARATPLAGSPIASHRCTTRKNSACSTASSSSPTALFSISKLQDTIYQFEHRQGVVQKIDEHSRQLAEALESAVPIIITTLQKFPFVSRQLLKLAEERGETGTGILPTRKCAVIVDEAHSSQSGETATDLKEVLGGEQLRRRQKRKRREEGLSDMDCALSQHGQARQAGKFELLRLHRHPKA